MKIREIILELREYMDRTKYGCWIDATTNKIYYVLPFAHKTAMLQIAKERSKRGTDGSDTYDWGFDNHFVRVEYNDEVAVNIEGNKEDLQRVSHILLATCAQSDIEEVLVDVQDLRISRTFRMPGDRRALMMIIKGETE